MSDRATRLAGLYAAIAATAGVLLSPLLALSYFGIPGGVGELRSGTVRAWAAPARDLIGGLLTTDPSVPYAQISAELSIPVGSIGPRRSRCLEKLRRDPAIAALINPESAGAGYLVGARTPAHGGVHSCTAKP